MKLLVMGATRRFRTKFVETLLKIVPTSQVAISVRNPKKS